MDKAFSSLEQEIQSLRAKVTRLEKVNEALIYRVEQSVNQGGEAYVLFQNAITLERKVKERTASLEATREKLEKSNEELVEAKERAEIATIAKSKFLANMSHEIRTPMNGMLGILQLVLENNLPEELRTDLNTVYASSASLLSLLNDILDFSKAEANRIELESIEFDLCTLVEDSLELFSEQAAKKNLRIYSDIDPLLPMCVIGDPARLRQVINNLVGNAVKFTEEGSVVVKVGQLESGEQTCLRIAVVDSGIGIDESHYNLLFKPFSQADVSTTRKYGGTGLGLAICSQIVECMGGEINVRSELGKGSEFWIEMPLKMNRCLADECKSGFADRHVALLDTHEGHMQASANKIRKLGVDVSCFEIANKQKLSECRNLLPNFDAVLVDSSVFRLDESEILKDVKIIVSMLAHREKLKYSEQRYLHLFKPVRRREIERVLTRAFDFAPQKTKADSATAQQTWECNSTKILVVDDNEVNQMVAERSLRKLGFKADLANNGKDAVNAHKQKRYDLIFMDCQMPVMDGYEASRIIRAMEGEAALVPIIALTANVMEGDKNKCLEAGMSDYLGKPVRLNQLQALMHDWINYCPLPRDSG